MSVTATCQNCAKTWMLNELRSIEDIYARVEDGEPMPVGECPDCGSLCHSDASQRIPRDHLPPFKVTQDFGSPQVMIGMEAHDGGRWAIRNEEAANDFQKLAQKAIDGFAHDLAELEDRIHFLLSYAVQTGMYLHVTKASMDELDDLDKARKAGVERRFELSSSEGKERIELACPVPDCGSTDVNMIEVREVSIKRRARLEDGRITAGALVDDTPLGTKSVRFECMVCHHQWEAPKWIQTLIDEEDPEDDREDW